MRAEQIEPIASAHRAMLDRLMQSGRMPHALLISGAPGIGKSEFAGALAAALLCEKRRPGTALRCGHCTGCALFDSGNHPDFRWLGLEEREDGKLAREISINQVRALEEFMSMSAARQGARVVVIDPAEALNVESSNALLKMLEEPGPGVCFALVTHRADRIMPTVRSRTRLLALPPPEDDESIDWIVARCDGALTQDEARRLLDLTGGAPRHSLSLADRALRAQHEALFDALARIPDQPLMGVADEIAALKLEHWYLWLQRWVVDLGRVAIGGTARHFPHRQERLEALARRAGPWRLSEAARQLQAQSVLLDHPLNPRLFLEGSLALYRDAYAL